MRIYYDWEFLEDGRTIDGISIGMVREDGKEYYAISGEFNQSAAQEHEFVRTQVLPHLPMIPKPYNPYKYYLDNHHPDVKGRRQIAQEVKEFVLGVPDGKPELWAYFGAYDHVALCQLFGDMMSLPEGFPMFTNDLKQEMDRLGVTKKDLPEQGQNLHKAIDDARWNKAAHEFLIEFEDIRHAILAGELIKTKMALVESEKKRKSLSDSLKEFGV